jgi:hypothetical protein
MKIKSLVVLAVAVGVLCLSGCASYQNRPDAATITIPKSSAPIPAKVGISQTEQKLTGGFSDLVPIINKNLTESGLFQTVYYPVRPDDPLDGQIQLRLNASFKQDPALFPKAFFTGFFMFLPAPLFTYKHHYEARCTFDVVKDGKTLKTYTSTASVEASHKLFGPPDKIEAEGTEAASKLLCGNLVNQLIADRAFLEHALVQKAASN